MSRARSVVISSLRSNILYVMRGIQRENIEGTTMRDPDKKYNLKMEK